MPVMPRKSGMYVKSGMPVEVVNEWVRHNASDLVEMFDMVVKFDWPNNDPEAPGVSVKTVAGVITASARVTHGKNRFVLIEVDGDTYNVRPDFAVFVWEEVELPVSHVKRQIGR